MTNLFEFEDLRRKPRRWLITGGAGFIGSNLTATLLSLKQEVVILDNFSTGSLANVEAVLACNGAENRSKLRLIKGDIQDLKVCREAMIGIDFVLHHAALGSVPHSIVDPDLTNKVNVTGFLNLLIAARDAQVKSFVYASSSAVYGDDSLPIKIEHSIGAPLSPYAASKRINEIYAETFANTYQFNVVGLRYFNIFGPRQSPQGAYAAVIPRWIELLLNAQTVEIFGEGDTSRDFCYVDNVVQANIKAAIATSLNERVLNIGSGARVSLQELFDSIYERVVNRNPNLKLLEQLKRPTHRPYRTGDIRHSAASIDLASKVIGYKPDVNLADGLDRVVDWFIANRINS